MFTALLPPAAAVLVLWLVLGFDEIYRLDLVRYGIFPRSFSGLRGVLFAPLIHGGVEHLFNNSIPLLVLGWLMVYFYPKASGRVVLLTWVISGLGVWAVGRGSFHIGASGVVYGLAGFVFFSGVIRRRIALMAVSLIVVFLYGSLWWGVLPLQPDVSWESHLFGGIAGSLMAWLYRKLPPAHVPPPPVYHQEDDEEDERPMDNADPGDEQPPTPPLPTSAGLDQSLYDPNRTSVTW